MGSCWVILVVWKCKGRPTGDTQGSQMGSILLQIESLQTRIKNVNEALKDIGE